MFYESSSRFSSCFDRIDLKMDRVALDHDQVRKCRRLHGFPNSLLFEALRSSERSNISYPVKFTLCRRQTVTWSLRTIVNSYFSRVEQKHTRKSQICSLSSEFWNISQSISNVEFSFEARAQVCGDSFSTYHPIITLPVFKANPEMQTFVANTQFVRIRKLLNTLTATLVKYGFSCDATLVSGGRTA